MLMLKLTTANLGKSNEVIAKWNPKLKVKQFYVDLIWIKEGFAHFSRANSFCYYSRKHN